MKILQLLHDRVQIFFGIGRPIFNYAAFGREDLVIAIANLPRLESAFPYGSRIILQKTFGPFLACELNMLAHLSYN
jgi:hypothetical protein